MNQSNPARIMVACGVICEHDGKILMVKEDRPDEGVVFNQPVGKLDLGEDVFQAAVRETEEETGLDVTLTALLGVYTWLLDNGNTSIRICFVAEVVGGELRPEPRSDDELVEPVWLTPEELSERRGVLRNPVTQRCLDDYLAGKRYPLEAVATLRGVR